MSVLVGIAGGTGSGKTSFAEKLSKYYTNHDRSAPSAITLRVELDGKRLIGVKGDLQVTLTATDAAGESATNKVVVSR